MTFILAVLSVTALYCSNTDRFYLWLSPSTNKKSKHNAH